ncbi:hypothetical protein, partial [Burkholderia pseudomallei]|uniref:hypothetical protein n=1 Tax=Burkholderia pseudomallei TaxID=28450 RepID=UPI0021F7B7B3
MTNDRCVDLRLANNRFTVLPETTLRLTLAADRLDRVDTVFALLPPKIAIGVPDRRLTERETAAAIAAVRLFKAQGRQVEVVPLAGLLARRNADNPVWQRGSLIVAAPAHVASIAPNAASMAGAAVRASVAMLADVPGLLLTRHEPQPGITLLGLDSSAAGIRSLPCPCAV